MRTKRPVYYFCWLSLIRIRIRRLLHVEYLYWRNQDYSSTNSKFTRRMQIRTHDALTSPISKNSYNFEARPTSKSRSPVRYITYRPPSSAYCASSCVCSPSSQARLCPQHSTRLCATGRRKSRLTHRCRLAANRIQHNTMPANNTNCGFPNVCSRVEVSRIPAQTRSGCNRGCRLPGRGSGCRWLQLLCPVYSTSHYQHPLNNSHSQSTSNSLLGPLSDSLLRIYTTLKPM